MTIGYSPSVQYQVAPGSDAHDLFQQVLNAISIQGQGTLYIEEGTYIIGSFLQIGNNTSIVGAGMNKTVLKLKEYAKPWWIPGTGIKRSGFLRANLCNNIQLYNFTIDGNKDAQNTDKNSKYGRYGLFTEACNNVYVDGLGIVRFQGYGFDPHGVKKTKTWSVNLTIINSYSAFNDWDGFTIDQSTNVVLKNNLAVSNGRHGYNIVTGTYDILIENNTAIDNGYYYYHQTAGCGLMVQNNLQYNTRLVVVRNNTLTNSKDSGICINDVKDIVVQGNNITTRPKVSCIKTTLVVNGDIRDNICNGISNEKNIETLQPNDAFSFRMSYLSYVTVLLVTFLL
jgi:parallel beta-helix repeat protein